MATDIELFCTSCVKCQMNKTSTQRPKGLLHSLPIPMTGYLPCPLGHSVSRNAEWYDVCPREDIQFKELHALAKATPPAERMWEMNMMF
jgi:hypothetical protein